MADEEWHGFVTEITKCAGEAGTTRSEEAAGMLWLGLIHATIGGSGSMVCVTLRAFGAFHLGK
jgi:hypothetical protein